MEDQHKKIEQYFANELSERERRELEQQLATDSELAEAFQLEKDLLAGIEAVGNDQLREQLGQIHREEIVDQQAPKVGSIRRLSIWAIAAILVVGLIGLMWWLMAPNELTAEGLYAEYAEYSFDFTEKGTAGGLLFEAEAFLDQKNYDKALPLLEEYLESNPGQTTVLCAVGVCRLVVGDVERAKTIFEGLVDNPLFQYEAYWYLGLAYLKQENIAAARRYLEKIDSNSSRYPEAISLLKKIDSLAS